MWALVLVLVFGLVLAFEHFAFGVELDFLAFALAGHAEALIEMVSAASLVRPAPRPVNSRMRCLMSEAIGLSPLQTWHAALEKFVCNDAPTTR